MISRDTELGTPEDYYSDSLHMKPSLSQSVYDNFASAATTPRVMQAQVDNHLYHDPDSQGIINAYQSVQQENEDPNMSWGQRQANNVAGILGFAINPINWAGGEVGSFAAEGLMAGASRLAPDAAKVFMRRPLKELLGDSVGEYIPAMIGKEGAQKTLSLSLIGETALKNYSAGVGAGLQQSIVDNYNLDQDHVDWGGAAREAGEMGAFGLAIGSIPFAWGILRGKINRGLGKDPVGAITPSTLDDALARGAISKDEHQWYQDYINHKEPADTQKTSDLVSRASEIINANGYSADTVNNEARFDILKPEDMRNLQSAISDQLTALMPDETKTALSDFIVKNRLDELRQDPKILDGVRGYLDFVNQKLDAKPRKLLQADGILNDHLMTKLKDNIAFSQRDMFRTMKKFGFESSHIQHLPVTIPDNMTKRMGMEEKINYLKQKIAKEKRKGLEPNKQTVNRIDELTNNLPKLLTPREELEHLWGKLLSEKGLPKNFERSRDYHRLSDLAEFWPNAKILLDRINLEHEYNRQEAFRDLSQHVVNVVDSDSGRISNPDNVSDYLKNRIESKISSAEKISTIKNEVKTQQDVPANADEVLTEQKEQIKNTQAKDARDEFTQSMDKVKEFKESPNVFKNLISCVMGALHG